MTRTFRIIGRWAVIITVLLGVNPRATAAQSPPVDLTGLSLENLMQMTITSVSREEQEVLRTPAAVYVITQQDIRRSGATDIAELLRMVPGVNVAQVNSSTWAISARGFNAQYATKLLVLIDGRSVYDPGFSGVFWHLQNLVLADIERIEVIRGPGATMWGANAMNGVISVTTKRAESTQGGSAAADVGQGRPGEASVRFGGRVGSRGFYRLSARQTTRSGLSTELGADGGDSWNATDVGFRVDWESSDVDSFSVQAGAHRGVSGDRRQIVTSVTPLAYGQAGLSAIAAGNVLGLWKRKLSARSDLKLQFNYDGRRHTRYGEKDVDTIDVDLQHSLAIGNRQHLKWGTGYRQSADNFLDTPAFGFTPAQVTTRLVSAFVQDELTLARDTLFLTVGTKLESSTYTGANIQPAVRLIWQPTPRQSMWAASARAVRTANRAERGMHLETGGFPTDSLFVRVRMRGRESAVSEELAAHEVGYRHQINDRFWFDLAGFYNQYDHLSLVEPGKIFFEAIPAPAHLVLPLYFENNARGSTYGGELVSHYQVSRALAVKGSYSLLRMNLTGTGNNTAPQDSEGQSPRHQGYVGSTLNLPQGIEVTGNVYFVDGLPHFQVPSYVRADAVAFWKATDRLGVKLVAQNLFGSHKEFGDLPSPSNVVRRTVHGEIVLEF